MKIDWQIVFNPFKKYSEKQLLLFGISITIIGSILGWICEVRFNGLFDVHIVEKRNFIKPFLENCINVSLCFLLLFPLAKIINYKTRAIDILNASMLYRMPLYILTALANIHFFKEQAQQVTEAVSKGSFKPDMLTMTVLMLYAVVGILLVIYAIVLLTNGFKTAGNIKKWQHFVLFTIVLLVGEFMLSQLIMQRI